MVITMRAVSGFLTEDGAFYETEDDAEKHEATFALVGAFRQYVGKTGNIDRFRNVITNLAPEIRRYLNAIEGPERREQDILETEQANIEREIIESRRSPAAVDIHSADDGLGGSFEGLVEQPDRGYVHVPDVGDSPRAEAVRKRRSVDGS